MAGSIKPIEGHGLCPPGKTATGDQLRSANHIFEGQTGLVQTPDPACRYITSANRFQCSNFFCSSSTSYQLPQHQSSTMPKVRDPNRVKRPHNSYMLFAATRIKALKEQYKDKMVDVNSELGKVSFFHFSIYSNG